VNSWGRASSTWDVFFDDWLTACASRPVRTLDVRSGTGSSLFFRSGRNGL
jgi:hypothetical protein